MALLSVPKTRRTTLEMPLDMPPERPWASSGIRHRLRAGGGEFG